MIEQPVPAFQVDVLHPYPRKLLVENSGKGSGFLLSPGAPAPNVRYFSAHAGALY